MARVSFENLEEFAPSGVVNYFTLKDDGDSMRVRLMVDDCAELNPYTVHTVKVGGYDRRVDCIRSYGDTLDKCPLCLAQNRATGRFYIPLIDEESGKTYLWDRGYSFKNVIQNFINDINGDCPCSHVTTITRNGAANDTNTTYTMDVDVSDGTTLSDIMDHYGVDVPDPIGTVVLSKTYEEMQRFVSTGSFDEVTQNNNPVQRRERTFNTGTATTRRRPVSSGNSSDIPL